MSPTAGCCLGQVFRTYSNLTPDLYHHLQPILNAVKAAGARKEDRITGRFIYYLVQLALGDGAAGTPLPIPVSKGKKG